MRSFSIEGTPLWKVLTGVVCVSVALLQYVNRDYSQVHDISAQPLRSTVANELRFEYKPLPPEVIPTIYAITPTYARLVQKAELTRISTLFKLVGNVHWIVIEDSVNKTSLVTNLLKQTGLNSTHLAVPTTDAVRSRYTHRGAVQRTAAVKWLRSNRNSSEYKGVVYFADDDNTYSPELFHQIRYTKKVSVFPVGLVGQLRYESAIVKNGKVIGWHTFWHRKERKFAVDMAGFAVNLKLAIERKEANFDLKAEPGHLETYFLERLGITLEDLEPLAHNCTQVLVWHTKTVKGDIELESKMVAKGYEISDPSVEI